MDLQAPDPAAAPEQDDGSPLLRRSLFVGGLALAGSAAGLFRAGDAFADGEALVAGSSTPRPAADTASAGTASPEGSRADHVHPTTGLALLSAVNTFLGTTTYALAATTDVAVSTVVGTEANPRFTAAADGTLSWGPGTTALDTFLSRSAPRQLTLAGSLVVRHDVTTTDEPEVVLDSPAGALRRRGVHYATGGLRRWGVEVDDTAESGGNAGSAFVLAAYADDGNPLRTSLRIPRETGDWYLLPPSSGVSQRLSIGDDATTSNVKMSVRSTLTTAMSLQVDVTTPTGPVDVLVATSETTATIANGFGSRALFQSKRGTSTFDQAAVAAVRDGADNAGSLVLQTANAGAMAERVRVTPTGNVGIGTPSAFGGGKGVIGLGNAVTVPTTNPSNGGILYATAGGLYWRGSAGTVTKVASA